MFCRSCGYKLEDGAAFCSNCGQAQAQQAPKVPTTSPSSQVERGFHMSMGACIFVIGVFFLIVILPFLAMAACGVAAQLAGAA